MCYGMGCLYEDGYTGECTARNGRYPCEDELYRADSDPRPEQSWQEVQTVQEVQEVQEGGHGALPHHPAGEAVPPRTPDESSFL